MPVYEHGHRQSNSSPITIILPSSIEGCIVHELMWGLARRAHVHADAVGLLQSEWTIHLTRVRAAAGTF